MKSSLIKLSPFQTPERLVCEDCQPEPVEAARSDVHGRAGEDQEGHRGSGGDGEGGAGKGRVSGA